MQSRSQLKRLIEYLPTFTVLLIVLGYLNLHIYYSFYGLEVYHYLEATEIIFSFASIYAALIGFVTFACLTLLAYPFRRNLPSEANVDTSATRRNKIKEFAGVLFAAACLIGVTIVSYYEIGLPQNIPEIYLLALYFIIGSFIFFLSHDVSLFASEGRRVIFRVIFFFLLLVSYFYLRNYIAYKNSVSGFPKHEIEVTTADDAIKSSSHLVLIGGTQNYLFLYNIQAKQVVIIPKSEAKEIKVKELRSGM